MNKYNIIRPLANAEQSGVYLATEKSSNKKVAIKKFIGVSKSEQQRLLKEAKALQKINHPNIVRVFDSGLDKQDNSVFYVMEYLEGKPLYEHIPKDTGLSFEKSWPLVKNLAHALDTLHQADILHLDIKPGNILWVNNQAKIIDFGLLNPKEEGVFRGTPGYIAPEIILGEKASKQSDIYCFGALLAFIWTGQKLFHDETPEKTMGKQLKEFSAHINNLNLSHVIKKATRKLPEDRYQSMRALVHDLANYQHEAEFRSEEPSEDPTESQWGHWVIGSVVITLFIIAFWIYYTLLTTV